MVSFNVIGKGKTNWFICAKGSLAIALKKLGYSKTYLYFDNEKEFNKCLADFQRVNDYKYLELTTGFTRHLSGLITIICLTYLADGHEIYFEQNLGVEFCEIEAVDLFEHGFFSKKEAMCCLAELASLEVKNDIKLLGLSFKYREHCFE